MTIAVILDGAQVNVLTVTVIDIIKLGLLIVGDTTGLVLLKLGQSGNTQTVKCVEKDKGLKILRPVKESNSVLSTNGKYRPQKTEKQKVKNKNSCVILKGLRFEDYVTYYRI